MNIRRNHFKCLSMFFFYTCSTYHKVYIIPRHSKEIMCDFRKLFLLKRDTLILYSFNMLNSKIKILLLLLLLLLLLIIILLLLLLLLLF